MKLLMENWKRYIIEEEIEGIVIKKDFESVEQLREFLIKEYKQRDIHLTEEEIDEIMGKWGKKIGKGLSTLALAGGLMGAGAPTQAHADTHVGSDADAAAQQQQAEIDNDKVSMKDDGSFEVTVETPQGLKGSMAWNIAKSNAYKELMKYLAAQSDNPDSFVFSGNVSMSRTFTSPDFTKHTYRILVK